jgi:hypothetical protein
LHDQYCTVRRGVGAIAVARDRSPLRIVADRLTLITWLPNSFSTEGSGGPSIRSVNDDAGQELNNQAAIALVEGGGKQAQTPCQASTNI